MRYKDLVTTKLENLHNSMRRLEYLISQPTAREVLTDWFEDTKEKIEEIQTLLNVERQD